MSVLLLLYPAIITRPFTEAHLSSQARALRAMARRVNQLPRAWVNKGTRWQRRIDKGIVVTRTTP